MKEKLGEKILGTCRIEPAFCAIISKKTFLIYFDIICYFNFFLSICSVFDRTSNCQIVVSSFGWKFSRFVLWKVAFLGCWSFVIVAEDFGMVIGAESWSELWRS